MAWIPQVGDSYKLRLEVMMIPIYGQNGLFMNDTMVANEVCLLHVTERTLELS